MKIDKNGEKGAAALVEATIVFPVVFMVIFFLFFYGMTFMQQSLMQYTATRLSDYLAKVIAYPGYEEIEAPFYKPDSYGGGAGKAMESIEPYRYFLGLFQSEYSKKSDFVSKARQNTANLFLPGHSFMKPSPNVRVSFSDSDFKPQLVHQSGGYTVAVSANTTRVITYVGQPYTFSKFFDYIGVGNKTMTISGKSTSFVHDAPEFVRITDMAFDYLTRIADATGVTDKIKSVLEKLKIK